jgi:hypothetical protein
MNCQDITRLLDDRNIKTLSVAERGRAERHLASCRQCAREWEAYERLLAVSLPTMPIHLAHRCRELMAGAAVSERKRSAGVRPALVIGFFLVGAAAAAVLSIDWRDDSPHVPVVQTMPGTGTGAEALDDEAVAVAPMNTASGAPQFESSTADFPEEPVSKTASAESAGGFTVAVSPLRHQTPHPDVVSVAESLYTALLDELRRVPNLSLVVLDEPVGAVGFTAASKLALSTPTYEDLARGSVVATEAIALEVAKSAKSVPDGTAQAVTGEHLAIAVPFTPNDALSRSAEKVKLVQRPVGEEAAPSIVDVVMHAHEPIAGIALRDADHEPAYDFVLDVMSSANVDIASNRLGPFSFRVSGWKTIDSLNGRVSLAMEGQVYDRIDTGQFAKETVEKLRKLLFEPDDTLLGELRSVILDQTTTVEGRLEALSELQAIAKRSGLDGRTGPVVDAVIEMAVGATNWEQRARIWRLMQGSMDPNLIQPLVDALLYDLVRLEAAKALETFADNSTVRAALDQAGNFDSSSKVSLQARWSSLSDSGRRDYVVASLLDASLPDAERLEPLVFGFDVARNPFQEPQQGPVSEGRAASALIGIIDRTEDAELRSRLIPQLRGIDQPDVITFLIERLSSDPDQVVRGVTAETLTDLREDPRVKTALENAQTGDSSPVIRRIAGRVLGGPVVVTLQTPQLR